MERETCAGGARRWTGALLWVLALLLVLAAASYQDRTGPSYPLRGSFPADGESVAFELPRTQETTRDARVELPAPGGVTGGRLWFKRFGTDDPYTAIPLTRAGERLGAELPAQPPAGKLEYWLELDGPSGAAIRIPQDPEVQVVIRFKGAVPRPVLVAHITFMFLSMLFGVRAGLAALFRPCGMRWLAWTTLGCITLGGMILGPVVQDYAFGEFWTGFPFGYDLTDNKTLIMWVVWLVACAVVGLRPRSMERAGRWAVVAALLIMMAVYFIPHSLRGSTLDYEQLDRGVPASEAIGTG
jgi:hypothetical protein